MSLQLVCETYLSQFSGFFSFLLHLDTHLGHVIKQYGNATYAILFGIVFCETGLVVAPFLPGDTQELRL